MRRMAERELDTAEKAFGEEDWPNVLQHVEKALQLDPDNPDAHDLLAAAKAASTTGVQHLIATATAAAQKDDWVAALDGVLAALTLDPDNAEARELRDVAEDAISGGDRTRVFVSSAMQELRPERDAVEETLKRDRHFEPWLFDRDASARSHSAQQEWRTQMERRGVGVTVVLLWKKIGPWTKDEIEWSRGQGLATLVFRKHDPDQTIEQENHEYLDVLTDPATGLTTKEFRSPAVIGKLVLHSLTDLIRDRLDPHRKDDLDADDDIAGVRRTATPTDDGYLSVEKHVPSAERLDPKQQRRLAPNLAEFVDRTTDSKKLGTLIRSRRFPIVSVVGPAGMGRTALVRHVASSDELGAEFEDGTAIHPDVDLSSLTSRANDVRTEYIEGRLDDLLQAVWEQFYDAEPSAVQPVARRRQLKDIKAFIVLPNADESIRLVEQLSNIMPKSVICVTLARAQLQPGTITLAGLSEPDDMVAVFESSYLSGVPPEARNDVVALGATLEGNPALIGLLGSKAFDEAFDDGASDGDGRSASGHPLVGWAASMRRLDPPALRYGLTPPSAAEVGTIGAATSSAIPREILAETAGSMAVVDEAHANRVLVSQSPRYRANPALGPASAEREEVLSRLFDNTVAWVRLASAAEIYANRDFVIEMLRWGSDHERWSAVIELGRAAEPAMAAGGRHGAWQEVLATVADAARSAQPIDRNTLAWAMHQLGTRALLRDELKRARIFLHHAFRLRAEHDVSGRSVTHRSLELVPGALTPVVLLASAALIVSSWLAAVLPAGSPGYAAPVADVAPDVWEFETGEAHDFTLRNAGDVEFAVGTLTAVDFEVDDSSCPTEPIEPGGSCIITITFVGERDVVLSIELDLISDSDEVQGDRTILLVGRANGSVG